MFYNLVINLGVLNCWTALFFLFFVYCRSMLIIMLFDVFCRFSLFLVHDFLYIRAIMSSVLSSIFGRKKKKDNSNLMQSSSLPPKQANASNNHSATPAEEKQMLVFHTQVCLANVMNMKVCFTSCIFLIACSWKSNRSYWRIFKCQGIVCKDCSCTLSGKRRS